VSSLEARINAACIRVATWDGHWEAVSVELIQKPNIDRLRRVMIQFTSELQALRLPSAPVHPIIVREEPDRPPPRLDRDIERGRASVVGRVRDHKFVARGHNTLRGAAGGTRLNAELLVAKKMIQ